MTSSDAQSPADATGPVQPDGVDSSSAGDEDFTDIEIADLDDADEPNEPGGRVDDDRLGEAHAQAGQLRGLASELGRLDDAPLAEHVDFYQRTHAALQTALSDIDNA